MADLPNYQYYLQQSPIIISQDDSAKQAESSARLESIKTLVHEAATRNALRARLTEIDKVVYNPNNVRKLDSIYDFQRLMINTVVVPLSLFRQTILVMFKTLVHFQCLVSVMKLKKMLVSHIPHQTGVTFTV